MRKGFRVTLATVAIAFMGFNAMAKAPTIADIPDIIVGDEEQSTAANVFVFPDALNLDQWVNDDDSTDGQIIWSYSVADPANNRYTINGAEPIDLLSEDPVSPPSAKRISDVDSDPLTTDTLARTITVRDELRSPVATGGGLGPYPEPATTGILSDDRVVTLWASDGSSASNRSILVYTRNDGPDQLSPERVIDVFRDFTAGTFGWTSQLGSGTVNASQSATDGLCLNVPADGDNDGNWASPFGIVELVKNAVWEARLTITTDVTTQGQVPLVQMVYDNFATDGSQGKNDFGGEMFILDNEGGANAPGFGRTGDENFVFYMAPASFQAPQFADAPDGFFSSALDADNDIRMIFRVQDLASGGYLAGDDAGSVCLKELTVLRHDFAEMNTVAEVYSVEAFSDISGAPADPTAFGLDVIGEATTMTIDGGDAVIAADDGAWSADDPDSVVLFRPGDTTVNLTTTATSENDDNWPIEYTANTSYYIEYELSMNTQAGESSPPDSIRLGADVLTQELLVDHFVASNSEDTSVGFPDFQRGLTMPRYNGGVPQKYACFFYSHSLSSTTIPNADRFRPRFEVLNAGTAQPFGRTANEGDIRVHSVRVLEIDWAR